MYFKFLESRSVGSDKIAKLQQILDSISNHTMKYFAMRYFLSVINFTFKNLAHHFLNDFLLIIDRSKFEI